MKAALLLTILIAAVSAFGYFVLNGPWWYIAPVTVVAVGAYSLEKWRQRYRALKARDAVVRRMVCQTFELGGSVVSVAGLAHVLRTSDVFAAMDKQRADEEALWIARGGSER